MTKTPEEVLKILHSIRDVRLVHNGEFHAIEVKFDEPDPAFKSWEPNRGYVYNSFTDRLLSLIEEELNGELAGDES